MRVLGSGSVTLKAAGCQNPEQVIYLHDQQIKLLCPEQSVPVRMLKLPFA
jgi:hypothetical protein